MKTVRVISRRSQDKLDSSKPFRFLTVLSCQFLTMDRRIEIVLAKIDSDPVGTQLSDLAEMVNLSRSRFRHLFKQETGVRPGQYLKSIRMRHAAMLLRTTFLTVKQIMSAVGLRSHNHFLRDFKRAHGMSPTEYRAVCGLKDKKTRLRNNG